MKPLYYYISLPLTLSVNCMFINVWQILIHSGPKFCDVETRFSWNKTHFVTLLVIFSFFISFHVCTLCIYLYIAVCFLPVAESATLALDSDCLPKIPRRQLFLWKNTFKGTLGFFFLFESFFLFYIFKNYWNLYFQLPINLLGFCESYIHECECLTDPDVFWPKLNV